MSLSSLGVNISSLPAVQMDQCVCLICGNSTSLENSVDFEIVGSFDDNLRVASSWNGKFGYFDECSRL